MLTAAWLVPVAPAAAVTVEGSMADTVSGSAGAPVGTVLTLFVGADGGTRVPRAMQFAVGPGLQFGGSGPPCELETVRTEPFACAGSSRVGEGLLETTAATYGISAFTLSGSALALRFETSPSPSLVEVTTATLGGSQTALTAALPEALRGEELVSLRLRLGGDDPAADWVRSTLCPNGAWSLSAALLGDAGVVGSAGASIGCRPPRGPQLGRITPRFSLSQTRRDGRLSPLRVGAVTLPAGLPADATVHVRCRPGCRGAWRARVNPAGTTTVRIRPGIAVARRGLRLEVSVASPSIRGTYLLVAFTRGANGRVNGWRGVRRGCVRLGSAPVRMRCPR
jgi:hypothetical protein